MLWELATGNCRWRPGLGGSNFARLSGANYENLRRYARLMHICYSPQQQEKHNDSFSYRP